MGVCIGMELDVCGGGGKGGNGGEKGAGVMEVRRVMKEG